MTRAFIFDTHNTYYDWGLRITAKDVGAAAPRTNLVKLDGMSGSLDLSEALSGEVVYDDRTLTASFETSEGTYRDREALLRRITSALHGRKVQIIEPDDLDHYLLGRVAIKKVTRHQVYIGIEIEATCDPWRYAVNETVRTVAATQAGVSVVVHNNGDKAVQPTLTASGSVTVTCGGVAATLEDGAYRVAGLKLRPGANVLTVTGSGTLSITYQEALL